MSRFDPIAIVGIGCRFPGASGPRAFWRLLADGVDAITEVPAERWSLDELHDTNPESPGRMTTRWGGFVPDVDRFDAAFFGIAPREAVHIDPQQRLLMEVAWEALEDAGIPVETLSGQPVGVFVGMSSFDYGAWQLAQYESIRDGYVNTGSALSIAANRLSYLFDFRGPSLVIDTACSSSLVAVHEACASLDRGDASLALAGGVNLILSPAATIGFSKLQAMAPDGRCKPFDASANGYVRAEGVGVVVLKPLARAVADGDPIYAVIRGGAVNQDGRTNGLTAPNGLSQEALVKDALANAGVRPADIQYVEAHGTGTSLGDPIELDALGSALAKGRERGERCAVGSVKSNVGHLEAAAGVAGLIKLALALEHRQLPPSLHFTKPNPYIRFDVLPLRVVTQLEPWPTTSARALGGVSAFGFGGTNAHLIVEEAPDVVPTPCATGDVPCVLPLSARSEAALSDLVRAYADRLEQQDAVTLTDICASAAARRTHHDYRLAVVGATRAGMVATLQAVARGEAPKGVEVGRRTGNRRRKVAFVFPGQGSQWVGMGRRLLETEPAFADALARCAAACAPHITWSLLDEIVAPPEASRLNEVDVVQPVIFAIEVALAELWRSWGIKPDAVIGHSMGETAAAYVAGALSLDDAARIICRRSQLARRLSGRGAMAVVELSLDQARATLAGLEDLLSVAVSNSPTSTVLAGDPGALEGVLGTLERDGVFCRRVNVDFASHSPQVEVLRGDLLEALVGLAPRRSRVSLYSTVTGAIASGPDLGADYWVRNLREPVLFASTIQKVLEDGIDVLVEVSPHPILLPAIQQSLQHLERPGVALGSLRRDEDERDALLRTLAHLYCLGCTVDWTHVYAPPYERVRLPSYPWQRERFWIDEPLGSQASSRARQRPQYPLLGTHIPPTTAHVPHLWQGELAVDAMPLLRDHRVQAQIVLPATAYLEMALEAAHEVFGTSASVEVDDVRFERAMVLAEGEGYVTQLSMAKRLDQRFEWCVHASRAGAGGVPGDFVRHAVGCVRASDTVVPEVQFDVEATLARCPETRGAEEHYALLAQGDLQYGPAFQGVEGVRIGVREAMVSLRPSLAHGPRFRADPALLDAALQAIAAGLTAGGGRTVVPVAVQHCCIAPTERLAEARWVHASWADDGPRVVATVRVFTATGQLVAELAGVSLVALGRPAEAEDGLYRIEWERQARAETSSPERAPGTCLVFADGTGVGAQLKSEMEARGVPTVVVTPGSTYEVSPMVFGGAPSRIQPERAEDYAQLLGELQTRGIVPDAVVHAWSLDVAGDEDPAARRAWCSALLLIQALAGGVVARPPRLWIVTAGAQPVTPHDRVSPFQAPVWGLARSVMQEHPELRCTVVDLGPAGNQERSALATEVCRNDGEQQVALRDMDRFVARLARVDAPEATRTVSQGRGPRAAENVFCARQSEVGDLQSIRLVQTTRRRPGRGEVEIQVVATGLNFRDVLLALGMLPADGEVPLGHECAGRISAIGEGVAPWAVGDEVVALAKPALASYVRTPAALVAPKPSRLDFSASATLPIAGLTAHYALTHVGRLQRGERVLIHSATGAVGLACLQVAQRVGATVYATAGTPEKRRLLEQLGVRLAMDSRELSFAEDILRDTQGEGIDVVVNSLAGEAVARGLAVLRPGGRFVELGKRDVLEGAQIPLSALEDSCSFHLVDLNGLAEKRPEWCGRLFREAMAWFDQEGSAAMPFTVLAPGEVGEALHRMARGQHIGKLVVRVDSPGEVTLPPSIVPDLVRDDATYVVTGGLGGLGLLTSRWLVDQGARHLALVGRRPPSVDALEAIAAMERAGAHVRVDLFDVADAPSVDAAVARWAADMPPLGGVVHAAGVLDDGIVLQQTPERFARVMAPKVAGAWNLHRATAQRPLDFFVMFSSAASMLGSPGQANYAAANEFMDTLACSMRSAGVPATSVNWGPWSDAGLAATPDRAGGLDIAGMKSLSPPRGLEVLGQILLESATRVGVLNVDWNELRASHPALAAQPFFARVAGTNIDEAAAPDSLPGRLRAASGDERLRMVLDRLCVHTAAVLRLSAPAIDVDVPLISMGIDSLMAVELKGRVEKDLRVSIPLLQLIKGPSLSELAGVLTAALSDGAVLSDVQGATAPAGAGTSLLLSMLSLKEGARG